MILRTEVTNIIYFIKTNLVGKAEAVFCRPSPHDRDEVPLHDVRH